MLKRKPLRNGRDQKATEGFSRITTAMQKSAAFRSLSASALRLLLWATWKQYNATDNRSRGETGNPRFKITNAEAAKELGMGSATFSRAKDELAEKGFLVWAKRGGLQGCNGVASEYMLASEWKEWTPFLQTKRAPPRRSRARATVSPTPSPPETLMVWQES